MSGYDRIGSQKWLFPWKQPLSFVRICPDCVWIMRQFYLEQDGDEVVARWYPPEPGMCNEGRGATVLEAIGSLCLYTPIVRQAVPHELVDTRFSVRDPACPRR